MQILTTHVFDTWLAALRDKQAARQIIKRIARLEYGLFGDVKSLSEGLFEIRIDYGAGYRLYYKRVGNEVYLILCAGDKSTQSKDIEKARQLALELKL